MAEKTPFDMIDDFFTVVDRASGVIEKVGQGIDKVANAIGPPGEEPVPFAQEPASAAETSQETIERGTACIPCSRDHISTVSSVLGESVRFARSKGIKDPEVVRRMRIALDELNAMERIDLAPDVVATLAGTDKTLASWVLNQSRDLRHSITAIKDVDSLEKAAGDAALAADTFMSQLLNYEPEAPKEPESLKAFAKRKQAG